jgi:hypothetical protein
MTALGVDHRRAVVGDAVSQLGLFQGRLFAPVGECFPELVL